MKLDIAALKAKLNEVQKKDSSILFKPEEGKQTVRLVPLKGNPANPFQQLFFHYGLGGKTYLSPRSYGETDPIADFSNALIGEGGLSKDDYKAAKKFSPVLRTYVPVVVRGKEKEGVKFWAFGKTIYEDLLKLMTAEDETTGEPEYGDITDVQEGRDIIVDFTPQEKSDTNYAKTSILAKGKASPLTTDKELLKTLLDEQPVLIDTFTRSTKAELEAALRKHLNADEEKDSDSTTATDEEVATPVVAKTLSADVAEEFSAIFDS